MSEANLEVNNMDQFEFVIESDTLIRNEISNTDEPNVFSVKKVPVINKEAFVKCFNEWIGIQGCKKGDDNS